MCEIADYLEGELAVAVRAANCGINPALHQPVRYLVLCTTTVLALQACAASDGKPMREPGVDDYRAALVATLESIMPVAVQLSRHRNLTYVAAVLTNMANQACRDYCDEVLRQGYEPYPTEVPDDIDLAPFRKHRRAH
jgi:hypothetical protein